MAEHMLIVGVEDPKGRSPSWAVGIRPAPRKTNFCDDDSTETVCRVVRFYGRRGYRLDVALQPNGRLPCGYPEIGYLRVAPVTRLPDNPKAMERFGRTKIIFN